MRDLKVGVVGLGWMGRLHAASYARIARQFPELEVHPRLVAAADPVAANREAATSQFGFERAVSDIRDLLDEVDVVSLCSPNFLHRELALQAAAAHVPFWIEKPMGVGAAQSREIRDAADAADIATAVGFNYRHAPAVDHLRTLVASGRLGRITNVRVHLDADYAASPDSPLTWRFDRDKAGSGVIGDLLSHGADLVQFVTGRRITELTAMTEIVVPERPIPLTAGVGHGGMAIGEETGPVGNEDWAAVLARMDDGIRATLESSRVAHGHRSDYAIEVFGTEGSARWSFTRMNEYEVLLDDAGPEHGYTTVFAAAEHGEYARFQPGPGIPMSFDDLKAIECARFLAAVTGREGAVPAPNASDGLAAAEVCEAVVRSAASGRWESVPSVAGTTSVG